MSSISKKQKREETTKEVRLSNKYSCGTVPGKQKKSKKLNSETINNLAVRKLDQYDKNCFFSTYGLFCLFEMLSDGSSGDIASALNKLICTDQPTIHSIAQSDDVFKNTSLIFHASNLILSDRFTECLKKNNIMYNSIDLERLREKVRSINDQLAIMTNNKITNPLSEDDFDETFIMLLINILYFKDNWAEKFEKAYTKKLLFKNERGTIVDMMLQVRENYDYYENDMFQSISIPYKRYPYEMVLYLPKPGCQVSDLKFNPQDVKDRMTEHTVTRLMLPKFKIEQEEDLMEYCCKLGLEKMFSPSNDFDDMFKNSTKPKFIGKIKQKTYINVDEDGTEAAAITSATMVTESACMPRRLKEVEFIADHPFSFFIMGPNNVVLFAGKFYGY